MGQAGFTHLAASAPLRDAVGRRDPGDRQVVIAGADRLIDRLALFPDDDIEEPALAQAVRNAVPRPGIEWNAPAGCPSLLMLWRTRRSPSPSWPVMTAETCCR